MNDCCRTLNRGFSNSEDLIGIGPASQGVFSVCNIEVWKAITGVVVLIIGLGREEGYVLCELGLITLLGPNATVKGGLQQASGKT